MNNFEFDKIVISIALGIFIIMASDHLGDLLYSKYTPVSVRGYEIEVKSDAENGNTDGKSASRELPEIIDMTAVMASALADNGAQVFKKCAVCHTAEKGGANKVGPNLWGIIGTVAAQHTGFAYSNAMMDRGKQGIKWSIEELYRYLYSPKKYVPGTKMAFAGIKDDKERADLIAYLATLSDSAK